MLHDEYLSGWMDRGADGQPCEDKDTQECHVMTDAEIEKLQRPAKEH